MGRTDASLLISITVASVYGRLGLSSVEIKFLKLYWYLNSMFPVWIRTHILSFSYPNRVTRGTLKLLNFA